MRLRRNGSLEQPPKTRLYGDALKRQLRGLDAQRQPRRKVTECPHYDRPHAAKGMCHSCYTSMCIKRGRKNASAEWRRRNPQEAKLHNRKCRLKKHGLTIAQYDEMWTKQGGKCANPLCSFTAPLTVENYQFGLHVDHCHSSGRVRGLLCRDCNIALGHIRDDARRLTGLIEYLAQELPVIETMVKPTQYRTPRAVYERFAAERQLKTAD